MAYEEIGNVPTVVLGGVDKKTGKKNPTQIEGYLLRVEPRPNKFNPDKPQNYYVFRTKDGDKGVYAKAGIDRELKNARYGRMTLLIDTGKTLDTGKGNPMRVFKAQQDPDNNIALSEDDKVQGYSNPGEPEIDDTDADLQAGADDAGDSDLDGDAPAPDEQQVQRPRPPVRAAQPPSADRQKRVQDLLNRGKRSA